MVLAVNMTRLRIAIGPNLEELKEGTPFDWARKTQLNVSEYSGVLLAMLLFIQYKVDDGAEFSTVGRIGALLSVFGSLVYTYGYSTQRDVKTPAPRVLGAFSRYTGFGLLCVQLYKFIKN